MFKILKTCTCYILFSVLSNNISDRDRNKLFIAVDIFYESLVVFFFVVSDILHRSSKVSRNHAFTVFLFAKFKDM